MQKLSCCPVVRAESMTLYEQVTVAGSSRMVPFEKQIVWLRESETKIQLQHRGAIVDDVSMMNDWYGYLTSAEHAVKESVDIAKRLKINRGDALAIVCTTTIINEPAAVDSSKDGIDWNKTATRKKYQYIERDWYTDPKWDEHKGYSRLEREIITTLVSYTSANDPIGTLSKSVKSLIQKARVLK